VNPLPQAQRLQKETLAEIAKTMDKGEVWLKSDLRLIFSFEGLKEESLFQEIKNAISKSI
jgi:hypothetical protein